MGAWAGQTAGEKGDVGEEGDMVRFGAEENVTFEDVSRD